MGLDICHAKPSLKTRDTMDYFTLDELTESPKFLTKFKHLLTDVEVEEGLFVKALFFTELYVQRKRMNKDFIKEFENGKLYFDISSVKRASKFLKARTGEEQIELEKNFKANFIDNFVEDESVFYASW